VTTDILGTALRPTEETEIEGLVAGAQIASVARGCRIESASYTTIAVELSHHLTDEVRSVFSDHR
jgi:hypothetical protein